MVLYLKLTQKRWAAYDYTNSDTYDLDGTIYSDDKLSTAATVSGFTSAKIRIVDQNNATVFYSDSIVTLGTNDFKIKFASGHAPTLIGVYKVRLILSDGNTSVTCVGINGSDIIIFEF